METATVEPTDASPAESIEPGTHYTRHAYVGDGGLRSDAIHDECWAVMRLIDWSDTYDNFECLANARGKPELKSGEPYALLSEIRGPTNV